MKSLKLPDVKVGDLTPVQLKIIKLVAAIMGVALLTAGFAWIGQTIPGAFDDWTTFRRVGQRVMGGEPLYGMRLPGGMFFQYPPWLAVALVPISLLPRNLSGGLVVASSFVVVLLVCRRAGMGLLRTVLVLLSPPMLYIALHGQIDALVMGVVLLPTWYWPVLGIVKPQVGLGLVFGVRREDLTKALILLAAVLLLSWLLFGSWVAPWLTHPRSIPAPHNVWRGMWPWTVFAGVLLVFVGRRLDDWRYFVAAGPFFLPYAALSSFIGPALVLLSALTRVEALVVWLLWWGAVAFRSFTG